jgi:hypothetical protein
MAFAMRAWAVVRSPAGGSLRNVVATAADGEADVLM